MPHVQSKGVNQLLQFCSSTKANNNINDILKNIARVPHDHEWPIASTNYLIIN